MRFLRTASTQRLLAVIVGVLVAIAAGGAIAIAASGSGPVPVRKPLAQAIRSALAAPAPAGITARIKFTNSLISSSEVQNPGPLLGGAGGRLWFSPGSHQLRLELQGENGDAQVLVNQRSFWVYDPQSNTVYEGTLPAQSQTNKPQEPLPTLKEIAASISQARTHANVSGAIPSDVAGRPTYTIRVSPQHSGGLLGRAELAWDALRGVPLRVALYASDQSKPVLELKATHISYGPIKSKVFNIAPPKGTKVVKIATPATPAAGEHANKGAHVKYQDVTGASAVSRHLSFKLAAPAKLVGLPQQSVQLLNWDGTPAALVTYGQNLGGIAVIEQKSGPADRAPKSSSSGGEQQGLILPTVSINGASGHELDTAIGTVVQFTRGGVSYIVLGSVPPAAAEAAARAL